MKKIKNIIILAGGESNRLWPLEQKNLFVFFGNPLLYYQITRFIEYAENLYIVASQSNIEQIKKIALDIDSKIQVVLQKGSGQGAAILSCENLEGETLVANSNDFFDEEPIEEILGSKQDKVDAILVAIESETYIPGGYLKVDKNRVLEVVEKPEPHQIPSHLVRVVSDYFEKIEEFKKMLVDSKSDRDDQYEKAISLFIKKGNDVTFVPHKGKTFFLKYPWHILSLTEFFLSYLKQDYIDSSAMVAPTAEIVSPVYIGENVKIGSFAKIQGPCYIGDNTIVGDYALVRSSHVGANSLIGSSCEVARSYLGEGVKLHRNYVGDSVLAENVLIGSGATTANFRFDEKSIASQIKGQLIDTGLVKLGAIVGQNSKIGVNATVLPGIKVGKNTLIGPAERVVEDIEDNTFFFQGKKKI